MNYINIKKIINDLYPFDGRLSQSWRIGLICTLVALISLTYHIPEASLSCYVVFFVMKQDMVESIVTAIALFVLLNILLVFLFFLIDIAIDSPPIRLILIVFATFSFIYLGLSSKLGEIGPILGLITAFPMTLLIHAPIGEIATRGLLYLWLIIFIPIGVIIVFNLFLGRSPAKILNNYIERRIQLSVSFLEGKANIDEIKKELILGIDHPIKMLRYINFFNFKTSIDTNKLSSLIYKSYNMLLICFAISKQESFERNSQSELELACTISNIWLNIKASTHHFKIENNGKFKGKLNEIYLLLTDASEHKVQPNKASSNRTSPFFNQDITSNSIYIKTSIKITLAAILCYLIYSFLSWEGIHTAMITCYVASFRCAGESFNKLLLRIFGCIIGAFLGLIYISNIGYFDSVAYIIIFLFIVSFLSAWISLGSEHISYVGLQVALAFFLISLQSFGPDVDFSVATDRILGILLGNITMYIILSKIWVNSISKSIAFNLSKIEEKVTSLYSLGYNEYRDKSRQAAEIVSLLDRIEFELDLYKLEPKAFNDYVASINYFISKVQSIEKDFLENLTFHPSSNTCRQSLRD